MNWTTVDRIGQGCALRSSGRTRWHRPGRPAGTPPKVAPCSARPAVRPPCRALATEFLRAARAELDVTESRAGARCHRVMSGQTYLAGGRREGLQAPVDPPLGERSGALSDRLDDEMEVEVVDRRQDPEPWQRVVGFNEISDGTGRWQRSRPGSCRFRRSHDDDRPSRRPTTVSSVGHGAPARSTRRSSSPNSLPRGNWSSTSQRQAATIARTRCLHSSNSSW